MKTVTKVIIALVVSAMVMVAVVFIATSSADYARITEVDYKAVVVDEEGSRGKVIITERLTFDIRVSSYYDAIWELWRDLPEEYVDGVKVEYKVNYVKQILADGSEVIYGESPKLYWYDSDYTGYYNSDYGPGKWYHSKGPYDGEYYFECVLFYVNGLTEGTVVFEVQYEMYNASLRYNDSSELYVSLYYGDSIKHLKSLKGQILFPKSKMPRDGNYAAYTYGTNSYDFRFVESDTMNLGYRTFAFELGESELKFKPYNQFVEFALISSGSDKHSFTQYAEKNVHYNDDMLSKINKAQADYEALAAKDKRNKLVFLGFSLVGAVAVYGLAVLINAGKKRKNKFYDPVMQIEYFRDIPSDLDANFASRLVFCKHKMNDVIGDGYSAAMLSLVHKGYIEVAKINESKGWDSNNVKIVVKHRPIVSQPIGEVSLVSNIEPLTQIEERYLNLIIRHSNGAEISHNNFQSKVSNDYEFTNSFVKSVKSTLTRIGVSDGYFQVMDYKAPRNSMIAWAIVFAIMSFVVMVFGNLGIYYGTRLDLGYGSFFIVGLSFIVSAIYLINVSKDYFLLTQFGEDEYTKWRALYNFLNSETLMKEREVLEVAIWEKYLIYATAFGISEKVIKALKIRCPETVASTSPILSHPHLRSRYFYSNAGRSFSGATRSASFTSRTGGYGGYGGGGRGGGGGGGGH